MPNIVPHQAAAMDGRSIPNDQQLAANAPLEMLQKLYDLRAFDRAGVELEIKIPDGQSRNDREAFPVKVVLQHRSLAPWRPSSDPMRPLAQSAFVHKYYGSTLLERFFFISGQRTRFHCRIAGSSRCVARPTGRWQLQPRECKIRQTCPG